MSNALEKIIELAKKTGDNCIVLDHKGEPTYVVVSFASYESMILGKSEVAGLTENELLEKINRDIANWKATQQQDNLDNWDVIESAIEDVKRVKVSPVIEEKSLKQANNFAVSEAADEKYYFEPID
ncbi:MAG: hypothetical protein WC768_00530 [Patescibacteria group bacterium]|jgi:hypothetical protein